MRIPFILRQCLYFSILVLAIADQRPNILFILTDDQDWHMESLEHMPLTQKYLINEGTLYQNHYCTVALCCPSRVTLWTGRAAHNTNVTDVFPPYGGYPKIVHEGINDNYLPVWLQQAGYNTYYVGKLWNAHSVDNYDSPYAHGFNGSDFLLDPYTYSYYNASMSRNRAPPVSYEGQYSPDITAQKAYDFLDEASMHKEPWMLTIAPAASHSDVYMAEYDSFFISPPKSAKRHAHLFKDYKIPRSANFNPEELRHGVSWMKDLPRLNETIIEYNDEFQRSRLRSLQAVDEMVETLVKMLERKGLLDNTYIFYTTDNGYHISQHRLHPGKECGFETDIHIPLIVRGPGVAASRQSNTVTSHTDLSPTIMHLAGQSREDFDGQPIPLSDKETNGPSRTEHINIEYWGKALPEGKFGFYGNATDPNIGIKGSARNNTYKGIRLISDDYSVYYSVWCTGDKQYCDLKLDPQQMDNYYFTTPPKSYHISGRPFEQITSRLDALMMVLKSCKAEECLDPWKVLHPGGRVRTLKDALDKDYDIFYKHQPKVEFTVCELGYIKESEGPQRANVFGVDDDASYHPHELRQDRSPTTFQYQGHWSLWT